jgi:CBS domain-containing protein
MKVSDILKAKGNIVIFSVTGDVSVYEAVKIMGEKNIGALVVMENNELKGIISERDYARKIVLKGKLSRETLVKEIMTEQVITVTPEDSIDKCMELMSQKHIRHLPIIDDTKVVSMISIGDVVNAIIESQKETIEQLKNYITG